MADPQVIYALVRRYRMTMGAVHKAEAEVQANREALVHLDAVLKMFRAEWNAEGLAPIRPRKPNRWVGRNQGLRTVLEVLREAEGPITTHEIVRRCYARRGMPAPNAVTLREASAPIHKMLRNKLGVIAHPGRPKRWALER